MDSASVGSRVRINVDFSFFEGRRALKKAIFFFKAYLVLSIESSEC